MFGYRGRLILILILLFPAAIPLPTGGFTHVFEIVTLVPILQLLSGKPLTLLPRRIRGITLSHRFLDRFLPRVISVIKWFEGHSRPRLYRLLATQAAQSIVGIILLLFLAGAFLAPPFSGLDTLPAMGATVMTRASSPGWNSGCRRTQSWFPGMDTPHFGGECRCPPFRLSETI
ncbi:MAG: exopolysaccharide biosynthesis protein [Candidatus Dormibacteria bacterium]